MSISNGFPGSKKESNISVTAFDWDGTLLGSFFFAAAANENDQRANAVAAQTAFMADPAVAAIMTHTGYDFLAWVVNEDDVPTSYGKRVQTNTNTSVIELALDPADQIDFGKLQQSITVKAAYTTNEDCVGADLTGDAGLIARRYQTEVVGYDRFGISSNYSIKIEVRREGVPRPTKGALRVCLDIDGVDVYAKYPLKGADVETVEIVAGASVKAVTVDGIVAAEVSGAKMVEWAVIDTYEYGNWVGAAARTAVEECQLTAEATIKDLSSTLTNIAVWNENSYPFPGSVAGINNALEDFHELKNADPDVAWTRMTGVTAAILRSIGIPTQGINIMRQALYEAWLANGCVDLTYAQIYEAASGQAYDPEPTE